ncbi:hypothetical protein [Streptomyces sp. NPDC060322]|uniref:hypothetical protein n=1 Tax=Streptomyces sp. NPDC060322 TaxID=3347097 RepID=UPI003656B748
MHEHNLDDSLPVHPHTGDRALGRRRDGRPIWPIRGGSGEGGDPAAPPAPTGDPDPAPNPAAPPAADPAAEQQIAEATTRAEQAAAERDELRVALDAVTKALNPGGATEQDPAALAAAVAERDRLLSEHASELRSARVELAIARVAADQGARGDRLLNSRSFLASVADLDPLDSKFGDKLTAAIKATVDADPDLYRATPSGPPRGGGEFNGPPAGERRATTLHDAVAARLSSG